LSKHLILHFADVTSDSCD